MLGFLVSERPPKAWDERFRIGQEQGRRRGNEELRARGGALMEPGETAGFTTL
jgi:hypothetical protein